MGARAGCPIIVKELLTIGYNIEAADIEAPLSFGQSTPLQAAAEEGHGDVVGILLSHGAKASIPRHDGKTAAMLALGREHFDLERRLKQAEDEEESENSQVWMGSINPNTMYLDMGR
jgi:ankyrin repeat protein